MSKKTKKQKRDWKGERLALLRKEHTRRVEEKKEEAQQQVEETRSERTRETESHEEHNDRKAD